MVRRSISCLVVLAVLMSAGLCLAKEYTIKEGDTISTVLGRFAPSEVDLREANPQKHDWPNLRVGEKLEIPYSSLAEVRALEARHSTIQNELSTAHESIVALTEARDLARSENSLWQSKFETVDPIAQSAVAFQKAFWESVIVFSIVLAAFMFYIWALRGSLSAEREAKDRFRQDVDRQKQEILSLQRTSPVQPVTARVTQNPRPPLVAVPPKK